MADGSSHRRIYDWIAPLYDLGTWLLGGLAGGETKLRNKVLEALGPLDGVKVVDLCCGTGTLSIMAAEAGAGVIGVDINPWMLGVARDKARGLSSIWFVRADSTRLPFRNNSFERVVISLALHEMTADEVEDVVAEALRVLKTQGRLAIFDYYRVEGWGGLWQRLLFALVETQTVDGWLSMDIQGVLRHAGFVNFRRTFLAGGALQLITVEKR